MFTVVPHQAVLVGRRRQRPNMRPVHLPLLHRHRYCLPSTTDLQHSEPQFKDGSVYRQNRPTVQDSNRKHRPCGVRKKSAKSSIQIQGPRIG